MKCRTRIVLFFAIVTFVFLFPISPWVEVDSNERPFRLIDMRYSTEGPGDDAFEFPVKHHLPLRQPRGVTPDSKLQQVIRKELISPPSDEDYRLDNDTKKDFSYCGQSTVVDQLLGPMSKGFFVEVGAFDGETNSSSLFFERERQWKGLLIEPSPQSFKILKKKHRKAFTLNGCLSNASHVESSLKLTGGFNVLDNVLKGTEIKLSVSQNPKGVLCLPLGTVLRALQRDRVDYLILDKSHAAGFLKGMSFGQFNIRVIQVPHGDKKLRSHNIRALESLGFKLYRTVCGDDVFYNVKDFDY